MANFDIDRFVALSGRVKTDDLDMAEVARVGLTPGEARTLRYMSTIETHTILYLRDLLAGHTAKDPDVTAFLSVWVFEELWHGRAIDMLLTAAGYPPPPDQLARVAARATWREPLETTLTQLGAHATKRFAAIHMTWGAINELTAAAAYKSLERRTANKPLATLLARIAKQERKHFSFYFHQAMRRLDGDRRAQWLNNASLKLMWLPVGVAVGTDEDLAFVAAHLFDDPAGQRALAECDATARTLPGLGWFDLVQRRTNKIIARHHRYSGRAAAAAPVDAAATDRLAS